jgi:hypothetical protein
MSKHTNHDFTRLALALGLQPVEAARLILDQQRQGRQIPRWLRRAARSIERRSSAA